jgi:hypothetical protein
LAAIYFGQMRYLILGLILIQLTSCTSNERTYYSNGQTKTELIKVDDKKNILKEYSDKGDLISEFELTDTVKNGTGKHFINGKLTYETTWINGEHSLKIKDLSENPNLGLMDTWPDTLNSGDTVSAFYYLTNKEWKIKKAFLVCDLDENGVLFERHRFKIECMELPIYGDTLLIRFQTIGTGNKKMEPFTIIAENTIGVQQAILIGIQDYYLK